MKKVCDASYPNLDFKWSFHFKNTGIHNLGLRIARLNLFFDLNPPLREDKQTTAKLQKKALD